MSRSGILLTLAVAILALAILVMRSVLKRMEGASRKDLAGATRMGGREATPGSRDGERRQELPQLRCPACAGNLFVIDSVDPQATALACGRDHRFYLPPTEPLAEWTVRAAGFEVALGEEADELQVIEYWLGDAEARQVLNGQLAEILRSIADERRGRSIEDSPSFSSCPLCAAPLEPFDQPDIWVRGLRCRSGHEFAQRGGSLWTSGRVPGESVALERELSTSTLRALVDGWLEGRPAAGARVHESVRRVLQSYSSSHPSALE